MTPCERRGTLIHAARDVEMTPKLAHTYSARRLAVTWEPHTFHVRGKNESKMLENDPLIHAARDVEMTPKMAHAYSARGLVASKMTRGIQG